MLTESKKRLATWRLDAALALLLILLAFAVRIHSIGFNSLSEDETAKWMAIQQYRQGHFAGVNSEHPMMLKMLAWGSLAGGERWNKWASAHDLPTLAPEGWLRLPNVLFGAATAGILYLLCRLAMGMTGSFMAGFFWAFSPLTVAVNRLVKEETALTFFTLLACYFYWRAKTADGHGKTRFWLALSAGAFGMATAAQYIIHLFGLNHLAWYVAGRRGLDRKPLHALHLRVFVLMGVAFLLTNPLVLEPESVRYVLGWLHHDGIRHTGYDFSGHLYPNFPSLLLAGVPWYFYLWMLIVKTPIPILVAIVAGTILLLLRRNTIVSCLFLSMGVVQLAGLSLSGAKWIRYSLSLLPFLYLAGGYAVQAGWDWAKQTRARIPLAAMAGLVLLAWPVLELRAWSPYYPFYLNAIGGGKTNIARYFSPDETSEFDTRQVAEPICRDAPAGMTLATARPNSMRYYLQRCGRPDIRIVALYDPLYVPGNGDVIVLERSRRFLETQRFFDLLSPSDMPRREVRVGPVAASTMYVFQSSALASRKTQTPALAQVRPDARAERDMASTTLYKFPAWQGLLREQP